jgi:hypothetical protein
MRSFDFAQDDNLSSGVVILSEFEGSCDEMNLVKIDFSELLGLRLHSYKNGDD